MDDDGRLDINLEVKCRVKCREHDAGECRDRAPVSEETGRALVAKTTPLK